MRKWVKHIIALALLAFLLGYFGKHSEQLKVLLRLRPSGLVILYVLTALGTISNSLAVQRLLGVLRIRTSLWEMALLQNAGRLLNYVPAKFGTVVRANYLKRRYGLSYTGFATMLMYLTVLMMAVAAIIGLIGLVWGYGLGGYESMILAGVFLILLIVSLVFVIVPLPVPGGSGRLASIIRKFLLGRQTVSADVRVVVICMAHLAGTFLLSATRIGFIYRSIGQDIHLGGYLVLGVLGFVSLVVSITPGSLGVRELVLGCGAVVLGVPFEVGVLAAMFERAVMLSWTFVVGGGCAVWLWHKYPADFRKQKQPPLPMSKANRPAGK